MRFHRSALLGLLVSAVAQATTLPVALKPQETNVWCWAASGQMVMNYLGATAVSQCQEANALFNRTDCCNANRPAACVHGGHTQLDKFGFSSQFSSQLSWTQIKNEIDHNRPISYAWNWDGGGGHVMVLTGYKTVNGVNYVSINDPWEPNEGDQYDLTYAAWVSGPGYTHQADEYNITDTRVCNSDFHDYPLSSFQACFDYQAQRGRYPVTLSTYVKGGVTMIAGSFQKVASRPVRVNMTQAQAQSYFDTYNDAGWRPGEISVLATSNGPRFNIIWIPKEAPYYTLVGMTLSDYSAKFNELYGLGWVQTDLFSYTDGGTRYAATWVKRSSQGYAARVGLTAAEYNQWFDTYFKSGLRPTRFSAVNTSSGVRYSALWEKLPQSFYMYYAMSSSQYQSTYNTVTSQGFRLSNISSLGGTMAATWVK